MWRQRDIKSGRSHATKWLDRTGALLLQVHTSVKLGACQSNALLRRESQARPCVFLNFLLRHCSLLIKMHPLSLSGCVCALSVVYQTDSLVFRCLYYKIRKEWCRSPTMTASSRLNKGHAIIRATRVPRSSNEKVRHVLQPNPHKYGGVQIEIHIECLGDLIESKSSLIRNLAIKRFFNIFCSKGFCSLVATWINKCKFVTFFQVSLLPLNHTKCSLEHSQIMH